MCWALAMIVTKWIKRDCPVDALPLTAWQMLFGALALCLVAWWVPDRAIDPAPYFFGALIYNAVLATAIAETETSIAPAISRNKRPGAVCCKG